MKKKCKVLMFMVMLIGAVAVIGLTGCAPHQPYSPCNGTGFLGDACGPELPVNLYGGGVR
jgi:hypothetical protein